MQAISFSIFYDIMAEHLGTMNPDESAVAFLLKHAVCEGTQEAQLCQS